MSLIEHAKFEFRAAGWMDDSGEYKDEMQGLLCAQIIQLLEIFCEHGHSGFSANYALSLFEKLAAYKPLSPLTGEDWEWNEVMDGVFQNKRCSHVFKQKDRFDFQPYDIEGKVFWEWAERDLDEDEEGYPGVRRFKSYYTNRLSHTPITFPYEPVTEYVERASECE